MDQIPAYFYPIAFFAILIAILAVVSFLSTRDTKTKGKPQTGGGRGTSHRSDEERVRDNAGSLFKMRSTHGHDYYSPSLADAADPDIFDRGEANRLGFSTVEGYKDWKYKKAKLARKQSWQANKPAEPASKFKQHKLECTNCGSPLSLLGGKLAGCEFCKSQYYLEGFEPEMLPQVPFGESRSLDTAYWVDGGISIRDALPSEYTEWV